MLRRMTFRIFLSQTPGENDGVLREILKKEWDLNIMGTGSHTHHSHEHLIQVLPA